jgi:hypothetical protein
MTGWLRGEPGDNRPALTGAAPEQPQVRPAEESWLISLAADVGEGKRGAQVGNGDFWERIDALWNRGHERLAIDWLLKFVASHGTPDETRTALRVRLVELLERRGDLSEAVPHLEALGALPEHGTRAHYLLAEHHRRRGDESLALRHYEAVLARDVDYPNVLARVQRLRAARGQGPAADLGATLGGPAGSVNPGGRYQLLGELGRGATAVVYLARDGQLGREVAIKLLHPHLAAGDQAEACARFFAEARVAASLRHPNIVAILDLDEQSRRIVMELCGGGTLRELLRTRGPCRLDAALERHAQILSALAAAHRRGVVHRDLKPANLMFRRDPDEAGSEIVLADFGVAHLEPRRDGDAPPPGAPSPGRSAAVGTLAYMAPEQRRGAEIDERIDLYAAAVVLHEMLTGAPPWSREALLAGRRRPDDFRLPAEVTGAAPARLVSELQRHLDTLGAPDAGDRPSTDEALRAARWLCDYALAAAAEHAAG